MREIITKTLGIIDNAAKEKGPYEMINECQAVTYIFTSVFQV